MELKLAVSKVGEDSTAISLEDMGKKVLEKQQEKGVIFYFSKENPEKDMKKALNHFSSKGFSAFLREIRFGLDEKDYIYELHII